MPVAGDDPFRGDAGAFGGFLAEPFEVGELGPHQQPEPVADVVVERVGHLDVAADGVEAERLGFFELVLEIGEVGDGIEPLRIIVLVEGAAHVERLAVEQELAVLRREGAEAEVAARRVAHCGAVDQLDDERVEVRPVGRPRLRLRHGQADRDQRPPAAVDPGAEHAAVGAGDDGDQRRVRRRRRDGDRHAERAGGEVAAEDDPAEMGARPALEPHRLPDAAHRAVPALLAVRNFLERVVGELGAVVRRQGDLHLEAVVGP